MPEIRYSPIGIVHSPLRPEEHTPPRRVQAHDVEGTVEVLPQYAEGLRDLEGFSHVVLLCHLHLSDGYSLSVRPPAEDRTHGVFATRSPRRPNPISLTVVRLRRIEANVLHVTGIDLADKPLTVAELHALDTGTTVRYERIAVEAMAAGVAKLMGADAAVAASGCGGPGEQEGQPPGTTWIAARVRGRTRTELHHFDGDPGDVLAQARRRSLELLHELMRESTVADHTTPTA